MILSRLPQNGDIRFLFVFLIFIKNKFEKETVNKLLFKYIYF